MISLAAEAVERGLIEGLLYGSLLGALSVGLTLIWGVMRVVNLAHGHLIVLAAMFLANFYTLYRGHLIAELFNPVAGIVTMGVFGAVIGIVLYYTSIHPIIGKVDVITLKHEMATLMATFGFGLTLYGLHYALAAWTGEYSTEPALSWTFGKPPYVELGPAVTIEKIKFLIGGLSLLLALLLFAVVRLTNLGLMIQAVAQDARALALVGIDPVRIKLLTTIIATVFAMAVGPLYIAWVSSATPASESIVAPLAFVIVVAGGLGSILGTYVAGVILGLVYEVVVSVTQEVSIALFVTFLILLLILALKPQGLFGGLDDRVVSLIRGRGESR
ncbi:MAG: branched-chain amino acid ABC transporter permease [Desulfurococcales archaeon]|nr:branched-chain amino acid ABC transporter permease [Desulfurococcales archaeon]